MIRFRNPENGEENVVGESERDLYVSLGWTIEEENVGAPKRPNVERINGKWEENAAASTRDEWNSMTQGEAVEMLMGIIKQLEGRIDKLEGNS